MNQDASLWMWGAFILFVICMLALDLGVFHRRQRTMTTKEALSWTGLWVSLAIIFNIWIYFHFGKQDAIEFFTGYVIEYSLSVDNLFVFLMLFSYFKVPSQYQHRVLFWGIIGALIMRGIMIWLGTTLIARFEWILYVFGVFLVYTGIKMLSNSDNEVHPEKNPVVKLFKKFFPVSTQYHGERFWCVENGKLMATPLLVVLICVEVTDLVFAVDSIPAIFAVTQDPFIIFTSNVFAILGLRSLYFALSGVMDLFHYLRYGLGIVLSFVGVKMLLIHSEYKIPTTISLVVVVSILALAVLASILFKPKKKNSE